MKLSTLRDRSTLSSHPQAAFVGLGWPLAYLSEKRAAYGIGMRVTRHP